MKHFRFRSEGAAEDANVSSDVNKKYKPLQSTPLMHCNLNDDVKLFCLQLERGVCVSDFEKIKTHFQKSFKKTVYHYDADNAQDAKRNNDIRKGIRQGIAPDILKLFVNRSENKEFIKNELKTPSILIQISEKLAQKLNVETFDAAEGLGIHVSFHKNYLHMTHDFHVDIRENVTPEQLTEDPDEIRRLSRGNIFALTFVLYILPSDTVVPTGMGSTSVASESHGNSFKPTKYTNVYTCPLSNCTISIFPSSSMHSVAPNPYFERATIAYRMLLVTPDKSKKLEWSDIVVRLEEDFKNIVHEIKPQRVVYYDSIRNAREMLQIRNLEMESDNNPYTKID